MNIVLATPPADGSSWGMGGIPVLGLAYLAGSIRHLDGVRTFIVDGLAEGLTTDEAVHRIEMLSPTVFGISFTSLSVMRAAGLLAALKKRLPDLLTLAGGYQATAFDDVLLREIPQLDLVLRGETDQSFPELCLRLIQDRPLPGIKGLSFRDGKRIVRGSAQYIRSLDRLPFPDRSAFTFSGYWKQWAGFHLPPLPPATTMISSRGCPNRCTFCSKLTPGSRIYRSRSAENVLQEILLLYQSGIRLIAIADENFSQNVKRVRELCHLLIREAMDLRLAFQGTLHNLSQGDLDLMHRAGFDIALVGVESGSNSVLKRYRKAAGSQEIGLGIKRAKRSKMFVIAFFIHGAPGETEADFNRTLQFVRTFRPHAVDSGGLMIHPGSSLWEDLVCKKNTPRTLEDTRVRMITDFSGQLDEQTINRRTRIFFSVFLASCFHWKRLGDYPRLLRYNPTVRYAVTHLARKWIRWGDT
jgi:anaerobic magnesium-protoporphyrin IX monomethyl ester cyclase